jgi:iron(III) transport system ATP-binding protein
VYLAPADLNVASFLGHASLLPGEAADGSVTCALGRLTLARSATAGPVRVVVRGEQVQVLSSDGPGQAATVLDVSFFGHDATVRVQLSSGEPVAARTPAGLVPRPGDQVRVRVVGEVVAFAEEPSR